MNKIILENDKIKVKQDNSIKYEFNDGEIGVKILKIEVLKDTDLELYYKDFKKIETQISVEKNIKLNIYEKIEGKNIKIRTKYKIQENSNVTVSKFNDVENINEYTIIQLEEENSNIKYNLKTIAKTTENYDILTYHNASNTISNIITNGVNIKEGKIKFNVSSFVPKGKKNCDAEQNNKIINLTENECIIKPNLYIDEYDVTANHAAWIGNFNEQELFYLMSRGIDKYNSTKLLIKGFLTSNLDITEKQKEEIIDKINEYWR